ncbi:MAG TPA: hypothetical protein PKE29_17215 [Phycisphaerales bacterium]|nr:hypothetical protein [Phycisphaerales bacterium]
MPNSAEQLVVRQHERFHCRLASQLRVAAEVAEQVILARIVGDGSGSLDAFVTDCSRGGLGVESTVFFPRGCRLKVRVKPIDAYEGPGPEMVVRVQRVSMLDRKPTYYLGVSFVSKGPEHDASVGILLDMARRAAPPPAPTSSPATTPAAASPLVAPPPAAGKGGA